MDKIVAKVAKLMKPILWRYEYILIVTPKAGGDASISGNVQPVEELADRLRDKATYLDGGAGLDHDFRAMSACLTVLVVRAGGELVIPDAESIPVMGMLLAEKTDDGLRLLVDRGKYDA